MIDTQTFVLPCFVGNAEDGLRALKKSLNADLVDLQSSSLDQLIRIADYLEIFAAEISNSIGNGNVVITICGDCLSCIGTLKGLQNSGIDPVLVWLDAHGDFHTWETTESNFLGGMPLAMISGRGDQRIVKQVGLSPLKDENIYLCDARSIEVLEKKSLTESNINWLGSSLDFANVDFKQKPVHLHFDTDFLSPSFAPAMRYSAPSVVSGPDVLGILRHIVSSGKLVSLSISAWAPELDTDGKTQEYCVDLIKEMILTIQKSE